MEVQGINFIDEANVKLIGTSNLKLQQCPNDLEDNYEWEDATVPAAARKN